MTFPTATGTARPRDQFCVTFKCRKPGIGAALSLSPKFGVRTEFKQQLLHLQKWQALLLRIEGSTSAAPAFPII